MHEIGKYYEVPVAVGDFTGTAGCIYLPTNRAGEMWVPVLLPKHEDKEIINFTIVHYHLNMPFLSNRFWDYITKGHLFLKGKSVAYTNVLHRWEKEPRIETRRLKCKRDWPEFPHYPLRYSQEDGTTLWPHKLKEAYHGQPLKKGHICPHRGADLSKVKPNAAGCRTCPMHGLIFDHRGVCLGNDYI